MGELQTSLSRCDFGLLSLGRLWEYQLNEAFLTNKAFGPVPLGVKGGYRNYDNPLDWMNFHSCTLERHYLLPTVSWQVMVAL